MTPFPLHAGTVPSTPHTSHCKPYIYAIWKVKKRDRRKSWNRNGTAAEKALSHDTPSVISQKNGFSTTVLRLSYCGKASSAARKTLRRIAKRHLLSCGKAPFAVPNSTFRIAERAFQRICFIYIIDYQLVNQNVPKLTYLPPQPCPAANNSLSRTSRHIILNNHTRISAYLYIPGSLPLTAICAVTPVPYRSRLSVCRQPEHCPSRSP